MTDYITKTVEIVGEAINGSALTIEVIRVRGSQSGAPKTYIQASLHGAEIQGNAVIYWLLEEFKRERPLGDVILVPHCNPAGGNLKMGEYTYGRFDPIMGDNWNDMFFYHKNLAKNFVASLTNNLSTEEIYAQFRQYLIQQLKAECKNQWGLSIGQQVTYHLQLLAFEADMVLDLHTGNRSSEHLYVPSYAIKSAEYLGIANHLLMDNDCGYSLDEVSFCPWWDLSEALHAIGHIDISIPVEAYTVELGNQESIDLKLAQAQAHKILNYLRHKGAVRGEAIALPLYCSTHVRNFKTFFAPMGGLYEFVVKPGSILKKGDLLATCLYKGVLKPIYMPEDAVLILHFDSAAIPKGAELAKFLVNVEFHS